MSDALVMLLYVIPAAWAYRFAGEEHGPRMMGATMIWSWFVSNLAWIFLTMDARVVVNGMLDVLVFTAAFMCWRRSCSAIHQAVGALAIISACSSFAFAWFRFAYPDQVISNHFAQHRYALMLNMIYVVECIMVGAWGIVDARRNADYHRLHRLRDGFSVRGVDVNQTHVGSRRSV